MSKYRRKVGVFRQTSDERPDRVLVPGNRDDGWRDGNGSFFHSDARAGKIDEGVALFNDEESMELLKSTLERAGHPVNTGTARAIVKLLIWPPTPKPEEPKYLGAKVADRGVLYEAIVAEAENTGGMVWFTRGGVVGQDWDAFSNEVQILFDGYAPNRVS